MRRERSRKRGRWDGFPSGEEEKGGERWKSKRKMTARERMGGVEERR